MMCQLLMRNLCGNTKTLRLLKSLKLFVDDLYFQRYNAQCYKSWHTNSYECDIYCIYHNKIQTFHLIMNVQNFWSALRTVKKQYNILPY